MTIYIILFSLNILTIPLFKYSKKTYLLVNIIPLWVVLAFRNFTVGADTISYVNVYKQSSNMYIPNNLINWFFPKNVRFENGYILFNKFLSSIDSDPRFLIVITSTVYIICLVFMLIRLNLNLVSGLIVFETLGFMGFFMSGIRQGLACSFCMVAFVYAIERKPLKFLLFNYLALSMHASAFLFLIVYLLNYVKKNSIIMHLLMIFFITSFGEIYNKVTMNSEELSNFSLNNSQNSGGLLNVIVTVSIILILLLINHIIFEGKDSQISLFAYYMSIIAIIFLIISLKSTQISRIALYFEISYFVIISDIFNYMKLKKKFISCILILLAMISYFLLIQVLRPEWNGIATYSFGF